MIPENIVFDQRTYCIGFWYKLYAGADGSGTDNVLNFYDANAQTGSTVVWTSQGKQSKFILIETYNHYGYIHSSPFFLITAMPKIMAGEGDIVIRRKK